jgi:hypothetical protein
MSPDTQAVLSELTDVDCYERYDVARVCRALLAAGTPDAVHRIASEIVAEDDVCWACDGTGMIEYECSAGLTGGATPPLRAGPCRTCGGTGRS